MNVVIANERSDELSTLDIDIIKSMNGVFDCNEISSIFKNFYFNKMILDATSIKDYINTSNIEVIVKAIDPSKLILFLPKIAEVSSKEYLNKLVDMGIYNYTNNINGVKYLINHTNTLDDVKQEERTNELNEVTDVVHEKIQSGCRVLGIRDVTDHAGATTLIYMLKRELERIYGNTVYAVEVNKHDLQYFNVENTISTTKEALTSTINKLSNASAILVDLNDMNNDSCCGDVLYLIEPSSIKLNKLMRTNRNIFKELNGKKIILNKSLLNNKDVSDFEYEARTNVFYNVPPLDERKRNNEIVNLINSVGLGNINNTNSAKSNGKIFGIFKF